VDLAGCGQLSSVKRGSVTGRGGGAGRRVAAAPPPPQRSARAWQRGPGMQMSTATHGKRPFSAHRPRTHARTQQGTGRLLLSACLPIGAPLARQRRPLRSSCGRTPRWKGRSETEPPARPPSPAHVMSGSRSGAAAAAAAATRLTGCPGECAAAQLNHDSKRVIIFGEVTHPALHIWPRPRQRAVRGCLREQHHIAGFRRRLVDVLGRSRSVHHLGWHCEVCFV
jgi:hypothetical protein